MFSSTRSQTLVSYMDWPTSVFSLAAHLLRLEQPCCSAVGAPYMTTVQHVRQPLTHIPLWELLPRLYAAARGERHRPTHNMRETGSGSQPKTEEGSQRQKTAVVTNNGQP